ncbi:hypothetical protein CTAM01_06067 [Colletotrichum tamarilloi]|uniref:Uncharacterized protein n=1 Tax=Colletotrichum tamarilloi TaxID=1209934 RepID=A0ABQ9RCV3_9PEZI|nr:uncharacterized protein CTAM01_06067 [Colletotrichum tamarilloi]KAK1501342.1 hypothetical protein CTAM01_06067 [Colletotrichum tamarilloi]
MKPFPIQPHTAAYQFRDSLSMAVSRRNHERRPPKTALHVRVRGFSQKDPNAITPAAMTGRHMQCRFPLRVELVGGYAELDDGL